MPKDVIGGIIIILVIAVLGGITFNYTKEDVRTKSLISTMTEGVQTVAINSIDRSSRTERSSVKIDKTIFENNFKKYFEENNNIKLNTYSINYEYRQNGENVKAIRVTLTDDRGDKYPVTVAVDTKE